jgi:hypothetical protein
MKQKYTAKMYLEKDEIASKSGDDLDGLYTWMLAHAEGKGNVHGSIVDNNSHEIVRQFRKSPPD